MATGTAWYNLTKPASTENFNLAIWNANLDQIDERMHLNQTTAFAGATELADGNVGNVPAPLMADKDKFLKGDGTWATPQGGGGGGSSAEEMTLAEYNALTTAEKNDGTIRFIPAGSGAGASTAVDMTDITVYKEGSMNVTAVSSSEIDVTWEGSSSIDCNFDFNTPIDVTDYDSITFKVTNGSCYNNGTQAMYPRWDMMIGLMSAPLGRVTNVEPTDSRWAVVADMPLSNHVYEETLDVSELTGNYYIVVFAHGWNTTIEDITLRQGGAYPSQIKYMDKTYADGASGSGGSESGSSSHTYSTTEQIVGTWIDGSDVYEKSFEVQITSTNPIIIEQDASYIDALLSFEGSCKDSAGLIAGVGMPANTGWGFAVHRNASNQLVLFGNPTAVSNGTAYVTIRYTKTGGNS